MTKSTNSKFECDYCTTEIFTASYLTHLFSKHFEKFLCTTEPDSVKNRKALSNPPKKGPIVLYSKTFPYNCCLKCNTACKGETICEHYHFNTDNDTKNHTKEHLLGCESLLQKVNNRMNNQSERVVEKVVEKVVYKSAPGNETILPSLCKGLSALTIKINSMAYDNEIVNGVNDRMRTVIDKQDIEIKRLKYIQNALLDMLEMDGAKIIKEATERITTSDMGERAFKVARDIVNDSVERIDDFDPFDEYEDEFSELKEVFPKLSLKELNKYM